jgi:uncharacterized protein
MRSGPFSAVWSGLFVVAAIGTTGCSPITRYYTLSQVVPAAVPAYAEGVAAVIAVGPVSLPDYVDRPQIVVRTSPNRVEQATFDQWGGSLDDMVPRVLVQDLAIRLPADHVVAFPQVADVAFEYRVPVNISQFDVTTAGDAVVAAHWQVHGRAGSVAVRETVAHAKAAGPSYDQRAAALSLALGQLTDEIAAALAPLPRGVPAPQPRAKPR